MGSPNWSKLPDLIGDVCHSAPQYSFFQALRAVETAWADRGAVGQGLDRWLRVRPHHGLSFPPSDLRACRLDDDGTLELTVNVLGFYGVDAPMPHYVLETAALDDERGARLRAFLDIFNRRLYGLLYLAWKAEYAVARASDSAYAAASRAVAGVHHERAGARLAHAGSLARRRPSAAGLETAVAAEMDLPVQVLARIPQWVAVAGERRLGGQAAPCLGEDSLLGDVAYVAGGRIEVVLGPMSQERAQRLPPGNPDRDRLCGLLDAALGGLVGVDVVLRVQADNTGGRRLGSDTLRLGWSAWLGEGRSGEYSVRIAYAQQTHGGLQAT